MITLSERQEKKRGLKVETQDVTGKLIEPIDPKTGNMVPARPLIPDPGFSYHPGKSVYGEIVDSSLKSGLPKPLPNMKKAKDYRRKALANVRAADIPDIDESMMLPGNKTTEFYRSEFIKRYGEEKVVKDVLGEPVILSLRAFRDRKNDAWKFHRRGHGESIPLFEDMVTQPYEVWLTPQREKSGAIRLSKRYVCLWKTGDKKRIGGMAIFEVIGGVYQGITSFVPLRKDNTPDLDYLDRQRLGLLLYPKVKGT